MSSTLVNYDDLYEEFLQYTSDSHSSTSQDSTFQYYGRGGIMAEQHHEAHPDDNAWIVLNQQEEHHGFHAGAWAREEVQQQNSPQYQGHEPVIMAQAPEQQQPEPQSPVATETQDRSLTTPPIPSPSPGQSSMGIPEIHRETPVLAINSTSGFPGGIENVWKGVPEYCKAVICPEDVPDVARQRGYFTVAELLTLKRNLLGRYNTAHPSTPFEPRGCCWQQSDHCPPLPKRIKASAAEGTGCAVVVGPPPPASLGQPEENNGEPREEARYPLMLPGLAPPPPYRTATLVLKLLQVGNYFFRSFSEVIPNRLRVMFNTQHLMYECQLPVTPPLRETFQPLRKVLTIDIAFDQITMISFGADKLFLRVDGAPQLTVTYNPVSQGDMAVPTLTPQDQFLLEQIDKGQLRLSPCHQLFFMNERLVHALGCQFKEYPRFRDIMQTLPETVTG